MAYRSVEGQGGLLFSMVDAIIQWTDRGLCKAWGLTLRIKEIIWLDKFVEKIESKHAVTTFEVEQILQGKKKVRRVAKGNVAGEDVYLALGQTDGGRYLAVFYILKKNRAVLPISARDMDDKERRRYERKG